MIKIYSGKVLHNCILTDFLRHDMKLTKKQIRQAKYRENGILVNGIRQRVTCPVTAGDLVEICLEDDTVSRCDLVPFPQLPHILYEDEDIIAVDKPAGLVVHPSHGHYMDSLANQLAYYFQQNHEVVKIRTIGRLDKETSGIVVLAKNQATAQRLAFQKQNGSFHKEYLALANGCLEKSRDTISLPIDKDPTDLIRMRVSDSGKSAITHYKVEECYETFSLVRLHLETGRTHQIRVHMAALGHPLLGDLLYGSPHPVMKRAALHAACVTFRQPFTEKNIVIHSPLPDDMKECLKQNNGAVKKVPKEKSPRS